MRNLCIVAELRRCSYLALDSLEDLLVGVVAAVPRVVSAGLTYHEFELEDPWFSDPDSIFITLTISDERWLATEVEPIKNFFMETAGESFVNIYYINADGVRKTSSGVSL